MVKSSEGAKIRMRNKHLQQLPLLVCSDIFGVTPALQAQFSAWRAPLLWLSPYQQTHQFQHEEQAYRHFVKQGGLDSYRQKLQQLLQQLSQQDAQSCQMPLLAVGFSAGAAALWCEIAQIQPGVIKQAFCFYGGQIRFYPELQPQCPTSLIWTKEQHFDVKALAQAVSGTANVSSRCCDYGHGFLNPSSLQYHKQGAAYYQRWLLQQLTAATTSEAWA